MRRIYKYLSLVGAKLVGRRHDRDVDLPGMKELLNAFVSKSDGAITARPDFNPIAADIPAISDIITYAADDSDDESAFLNSTVGIYGTDSVVHVSNIGVFSDNDGEYVAINSEYANGTVTGTSGSSLITGTNTSWLKNAWAGCLIQINDSGEWYKIASVQNDTEINITGALSDTYSGDHYTIRQTHQPDHSDYKCNMQPYTSGLIYSSPTITMPIESRKICGPFYANVSPTVADNTATDGSDTLDDDVNQVDFGPRSISRGYTGAGDAMAAVSTSAGTRIIYNDQILYHDNWAYATAQPADFGYDGNNVHVDKGLLVKGGTSYSIVGGKQTSTSRLAVAYSENDGSDPWALKVHPSVSGAIITMAHSGAYRVSGVPQTVWVVAGATSQDAYWTYDGFTTWTAVTGLSLAVGDYITAVRSGLTQESYNGGSNNSFIILTNDGEVYLSNDDEDCAFTLIDTLGGGSGWKDCAYDTVTVGNDAIRMWYFIRTDIGGGTEKPIARMDYTVAGAARSLGDPSMQYEGVIAGTSLTNKHVMFGKYPSAYGDVDLADRSFVSDSDSASVQIFLGDAGTNVTALTTSSNPTAYVGVIATTGSTDLETVHIAQTIGNVTWSSPLFEPLSDEHRSLSHSVLDGYVMLVGVSDWDDDANVWVYTARKIRWSTPATYNDFTSSGAGSAELDGTGTLLDSRSVNGRIVTFESSAIGAISPRGYATDPWEYDRIKDNIRAISNPVVVDDMCYFIDDSGLLRATNGVSVESPPYSFDLTEYDDFNADKPVWMTYAPELESLCIYNPDDANRYIYFVETATGTVSRFQAAAVDGASPKSVVCVENSDDRRMMVSFNPIPTDTDSLTVAELSTGTAITGLDEWTSSAGDDTYHNTDVQTPQVFIVPEGGKTGLKHLIVNTYTDGTSEATNPILVVQCKSLEDEAWHDNGDRNGTITVTDTVCTGSGTAWSNTLGASGSTVYNTPCLATQARVYVGSTLQTLGTEYTITDTKEITFGSATGDTVYAYWENNPEVVSNAGDMIQTTEGWHRVSSFDTATTATLDHYMSTGETDATATHHHGTPFPVGEGQIKIGISKLVEGVKLRFLIFHRDDGDATVTKITGVSVGHIPAGEKIVEP